MTATIESETTTAKPAVVKGEPKSMAAFVRLCRANGSLIITKSDARASGCCTFGTDAFCKKYLAGAQAVELNHLIPYILKGHDYWNFVMYAIQRGLKRHGALDENYWRSAHRIQEPTRQIEVCIYH